MTKSIPNDYVFTASTAEPPLLLAVEAVVGQFEILGVSIEYRSRHVDVTHLFEGVDEPVDESVERRLTSTLPHDEDAVVDVGDRSTARQVVERHAGDGAVRHVEVHGQTDAVFQLT